MLFALLFDPLLDLLNSPAIALGERMTERTYWTHVVSCSMALSMESLS